MTIRGKILASCLTLTLITLVLGLLGQGAQTRLRSIALHLYDDALISLSYLRSAQNAVVVSAREVASGAPVEALQERLDNAAEDLGIARNRAMSSQGAAIAERLQHAIAELRETAGRGTAPPVIAVDAVSILFDEAVEVFAGDGYRARRAAVAVADRTAQQTWVAMTASILLALVVTALLARAIVPSLRHAVQIASAIAAGKLDNGIDTSGRSETGALMRALSTMQAGIAGHIARIEALMADQASHHAIEIADQHQRFEAALDNMTQGLAMFDATGRIMVANRRFAEMFGTPAPGASAHEIIPGPLVDPPPGAVRTLADGRAIATLRRAMATGGWLSTFEDVTDRHRAEERLAHMARHDTLTGLPNRVLYREQVEHALTQVRRGGSLAVLCLDLDNFKAANDALGHAVGDSLLRAAAARLLDATRESDMVVRLGGDEFAIVQSGAAQPTDAKALAERLVEALGQPFDVAGQSVALGASIGIAVTDDGQTTADGFLKSADLALYQAKAQGRGTYCFFQAEMNARMQARRTLEVDLRHAVATNAFENFYQPLIATRTRTISGFEALVRWRHPERGMVSPADFIPLAEEIGLISAIGAGVLDRACRDAAGWPDHIMVAVNLSPVQFRNRGLAQDVAAALARAGLEAARLELEITESLLLQDCDATLDILHELRALGVRISMDDFGTGYSSLSYLRRFPFDKIKIDQSFVRNLEDRGDCIAIIRAVAGLGASLGMTITAEGVETEEQFAILRTEPVHLAQGYLFSPPRPVAEVPGLLLRFAGTAPQPNEPTSCDTATAISRTTPNIARAGSMMPVCSRT